jgi:hypothetical protein
VIVTIDNRLGKAGWEAFIAIQAKNNGIIVSQVVKLMTIDAVTGIKGRYASHLQEFSAKRLRTD